MKAEEEEWQKKDPILRFREYLKGKGLWDELGRRRSTRKSTRKFAAPSRPPKPTAISIPLICSTMCLPPCPHLQAQQAELRAVLGRAQEVSHA